MAVIRLTRVVRWPMWAGFAFFWCLGMLLTVVSNDATGIGSLVIANIYTAVLWLDSRNVQRERNR